MNKVWSILRWLLVILACLWLALCTSVGPIYRANGSIVDFSWLNGLIFAASFLVYLGIVLLLAIPSCRHSLRSRFAATAIPKVVRTIWHPVHNRWQKLTPHIVRLTDRWWKLWLVLLVGWLWAYVVLVSAFGADVFSQLREFASAWAQSHGEAQPYLDGTQSVNTIMDVYPTAHYLWPDSPTFLTNQHNIVLTVFYGGVLFASRQLTGLTAPGLVLLSGLQYLFAAFCCSATANRFLNRCHTSGAAVRFAVLVCLLLNPLVVFSTISLTKSPLFAFTFLWWFGIHYELHTAASNHANPSQAIDRRLIIPLTLSTLIMLFSAKYAIYIVSLQLVLALLAHRRHWKTYVVALLLPLLACQSMLTALNASGTIIGGDPIESKGVQLQQIGRAAQRHPELIPAEARTALDPIIDLNAAANAYNPQDADPMKSSGSDQYKAIVYRWKTVTEEDMKQFNQAWLQIGMADPIDYIDGALAKMYGYFDVTDSPYVAMTYYIDNTVMERESPGIKHWLGGARDGVAAFVNGWSSIPVLGWLVHGNLYVVLTLLVGAAEVIRHRWRSLAFHLPMLLLMGVMMTAPANNFERHMLPLAFAFVFLLIWYVRESRSESPSREITEP